MTPLCHHFLVNRTDRLYALAEELRRAGPRGRTARRLADRFEVSTRTIKRDLAALQQSGLPLRTQAGPGGGYVLDAAATLPPINLTPSQAVAVAAALAVAGDGPFARDGAAALAKIFDVLDPASRRQAEDLAGRVWVEETASGPSPLEIVAEALRRRVVVAITYVDAHGRDSRRRVEPIKFAHMWGRWYLAGWCREREAVRWFRRDRITAARLTAEPTPEHDIAIVGTPPPEARPVGPPEPA
ncbi:transcriptional regulator [Planomonospora sphaerica]|uniref:Transcriptional regulator n=1 Tax=Planomonospora sphaerica TaxID=161355 RepID=A0A171DQS8_9ACTN|nr:transcriptional regulator [Planomonospora sphaerica]